MEVEITSSCFLLSVENRDVYRSMRLINFVHFPINKIEMLQPQIHELADELTAHDAGCNAIEVK